MRFYFTVHLPAASHLGVFADGAAPGSGGDIVGEVGGHQYRVSGGEGAGLAVAHAGVDQVGAFAGSPAIAADGHVDGWRRRRRRGKRTCEYLRRSSFPKK